MDPSPRPSPRWGEGDKEIYIFPFGEMFSRNIPSAQGALPAQQAVISPFGDGSKECLHQVVRFGAKGTQVESFLSIGPVGEDFPDRRHFRCLERMMRLSGTHER